MAMNAMLEDMTEEEIDALSEGLSGGHEDNNPTSVGEMVKPIIEEQEEQVQVIKKKVEDLKKEVTTKEDAIEILGLEVEDEDLSEEELYRRAMDKKAKEEMKQFISKKNDND
jgi:predicted phage tail protein